MKQSIATNYRSVKKRKMKQYAMLYLFVAPMIIFYIIFNYMPMYGILLAFKDFWLSKGILGSPWVGFDNFISLFESNKFWSVFMNTLIISFEKIIFCFPAPIVLALMINEVYNSKLKRTVQTIVYMPHFLSWVVIAGILFSLLDTEGLVNSIIRFFGGNPVNFLTSNTTFRPLVVLSAMWKESGWGAIVYLAALSGISQEYYEAALIDGASRMKMLTKITLPLLMPTICTMLILRVGSLMSGGFDQIFNLYNSAVYETGDIIDTYIYRIGLTDGKFSMATAVGLFLNVINCSMLLSVNAVLKKIRGYGLV